MVVVVVAVVGEGEGALYESWGLEPLCPLLVSLLPSPGSLWKYSPNEGDNKWLAYKCRSYQCMYNSFQVVVQSTTLSVQWLLCSVALTQWVD
jgi:hypothetical protein